MRKWKTLYRAINKVKKDYQKNFLKFPSLFCTRKCVKNGTCILFKNMVNYKQQETLNLS